MAFKQVKKSLEEMSKIELFEYAKRCRFMLGKLHSEMDEDKARIKELEEEIEDLKKKA